MQFREFGNKENPTIILLHGGGLSWWSLEDVVHLLQEHYHVITPIIDGYAEASTDDFISIEDSAKKLVAYINLNCGGNVFALGGLSLGAQIVVEVLSLRPDITTFAIIESALVCPIPGVRFLAAPMCHMSYGLIKKKWFSKLQAKELCIPDSKFENYYIDSIKVSKRSLINTILSNGTYGLRPEICQSKAKTLIIVGEKEIALEKNSAKILHQAISESRLYIAGGKKHGELSLSYPEQYVILLKDFFS